VAFRDALHGVVVGGDYQQESAAVDNAAWTSDGGATWTLVKGRGLSGFRSVVAFVSVADRPNATALIAMRAYAIEARPQRNMRSICHALA